jgi:hypothetical protein
VTESPWTREPGTIDDLIADAKVRNFPAGKRLIYDWVEIGLLDHPERRPLGQGGSEKALWPWTQRNLFRVLVEKRPDVKSVATLCNIPVGMWLWFGEDYVPVHQVQLALRTWAGGAYKVSWTAVRRQAREIVDLLDDLDASRSQRERLISALAKIGHDGPDIPFDRGELEDAMREVFDPDPASNGRAFGAPGASLTITEYVDGLLIRMLGAQRSRAATAEELGRARLLYVHSHLEYEVRHETFAIEALRPQDAAFFKSPMTWTEVVNNACARLCLMLGTLAVQSNAGNSEPTSPEIETQTVT